MVEVKIQTPGQRMRERTDRLRKLHHRPGIRVEPKNDELRRVLKHPSSNMGFRSEGSVEWPDDNFTHRRIRDGDVTVVEQKEDKDDKQPAAKPAAPRAAAAQQARGSADV